MEKLGFNDFSAAQAGCAHADALSLSANLGVHRTQVDVPAPLGDVVGVADAVSRLRLLAADITLLCHRTAAPRSAQNLWSEASFYRSFPQIGNAPFLLPYTARETLASNAPPSGRR